ncbi:ATP-binding cassette domain-containing protein [Runella sp. MFBS21]|uniref:ATP-binding cassette domain-containing protein n=1 Tax=Runella sp. MFBS21 TaxID=3034018 RepID=UPI0023F6D08D|nr:ATP-binding cassette domain-containing protein [Runella sp. MFBS21]MDF7821896.1 ATP-binding cassette domain-containing protein [Runella sp. MFBS21]
MFISLQNAFVRRYDTVVLSELEVTFKTGEQWAIIGPNGSGKSSLIEVLAGKWPVWRGKITHDYGGVLLSKVAELVPSDYSFNRIVKSAAQYYQQRFHSYEAAIAPSVREVLTNQLKPVGTVDEQSVVLAPSEISELELLRLTELLSINHLLERPFVTLSNGETRRMMLCRSLLKMPKILLLDNPFAGLDVHSRDVLRSALQQLKEAGVLVIFVTSTSEIPESVTHILELDHGKIKSQKLHNQNHESSEKQEIKATEIKLPQLHSSTTLNLQSLAFEYAVNLRNINVTYGSQKVLDNVNWKVKKGEKWALVGPNGSGKSTLLSILTADNPQRFANDYDLFDQKRGGPSMWDVKSKIGHVSPELHLYFPQETTVFKTIASGFFDATGIYFRKLTEQQIQQTHLVAEWLQVADLLEKLFKNLSKGQQRLVLLARALVKNPPLLILDEPCQGLDFATVEHFKTVVDTICASSERTLIYVSHYPHEIPSCVTHTLRLAEGKVV